MFAAKGERLRQDVIRLALFEMLNGATDLAIETLLRAVTRRMCRSASAGRIRFFRYCIASRFVVQVAAEPSNVS